MRIAPLPWALWGACLAATAAAGTLALGDYFSSDARTFTPASAIVTQAPGAQPPLAAVFWSGDMGLHVGFGSDLPDQLAARGIPVLAVSSPVVFGRERSAAFAQSQVAKSLADALHRSGAQRVALLGFSFGADLLGATIGDLAPQLRRRIRQVILVGPSSDVHFHANPFGMFYRGPSEAEPGKMASALRGIPLTCIFAAAEADSLCREPLLTHAQIIPIDDNHLMLAHREEVTAAVVAAILRPPELLR